MWLFCLLHSPCVSEPFAALPPLRIAGLYIAFACRSKARVTTPLPRIAYQSLCYAEQSMPRHCYALQHHAVAVQCLSSPFGAMPLPRDTMRFIAYPLLLCAFRGFSSALVAYRCLRCESCCPRCGSLHCFAFPLLRRAVRGRATPLPFAAGPIYALALNRALRK
nr:MAG TPA: hypothetical protein [Caudoviricetes sp.]